MLCPKKKSLKLRCRSALQACEIELPARRVTGYQTPPARASGRHRCWPFRRAAEKSFRCCNGAHPGAVRHCIENKCDVVAEVIGAARRRFDSDTCCDSGEHDLRHSLPLQVIVQRSAVESSPAFFRHFMMAGYCLEFGNKFGPVRGKGKFAGTGVGSSGGGSRHVYQDNRQAAPRKAFASWAVRVRSLRSGERSAVPASLFAGRLRPGRIWNRVV